MRVTLIPAHNPGPYTGDGNNTYLVGGPDAVLIDAGVGDARHLDDLARALDAHRARLSAVLVTHGHVDHVSGVEAIAGRWPDVQLFRWPQPDDARWKVAWRPLADGDRIPAGDIESTRALEVVHTPGHAPDHLAFWDARSRTLFAGDLMVQGGSVLIPASRGGSVSQYLASLARLAALGASCCLPAHGPRIDAPSAVIDRLVRHRHAREAQILAAVRGGDLTLESIVARVYDRLDEALKPAATETVLAHLLKLEEDRQVVRDPRGPSHVWRALEAQP